MCSRRKDAQPGNYTSCQFVMHEHFGQTVADYLISGERTPKLNTTVRVFGRQFEHPPQNPQAFGDSCAGTPVLHAFNSEDRTCATGDHRCGCSSGVYEFKVSPPAPIDEPVRIDVTPAVIDRESGRERGWL